jgi:hypothetical protein
LLFVLISADVDTADLRLIPAIVEIFCVFVNFCAHVSKVATELF